MTLSLGELRAVRLKLHKDNAVVLKLYPIYWCPEEAEALRIIGVLRHEGKPLLRDPAVGRRERALLKVGGIEALRKGPDPPREDKDREQEDAREPTERENDVLHNGIVRQGVYSRYPMKSQRVRTFFRNLGPGLISGAADDDPSGVSTYSVAGASLGYSLLWMVPFVIPLVIAVQLMCARLGLVTGLGLAGVIRRRYPPWVLFVACALLAIANIVNIGADLGGMAAGMELVTGITARLWLVVFVVGLIGLLLFTSYATIARIFKWLTLVLFAYVATAFLAHPNLREILRGTFTPQIHGDKAFLSTFIAVIGTTISPYLFFWQAAQEVEEERAQGRKTLHDRRGATAQELKAARNDVMTGMLFAAFIMYFIVLTTAATLHASGKTDIATAHDAAEALRPLAGDAAALLFTLGIVGTGMLGVPVLAGSAAYAITEAEHWRGSLNDKPKAAPRFYAVLILALLLGLAMEYLKLDPVKALFWAAVINGALAPPLIALVTLLTSDHTVMGEHTSPPLLKVLGWFTFALMTIATIAMLITLR